DALHEEIGRDVAGQLRDILDRDLAGHVVAVGPAARAGAGVERRRALGPGPGVVLVAPISLDVPRLLARSLRSEHAAVHVQVLRANEAGEYLRPARLHNIEQLV